MTAALAFWPSAAPLRALVLAREAMAPADLYLSQPWQGSSIAALLVRAAAAWGANPFLDRLPVLLSDVRVVLVEGSTGARVAAGYDDVELW